MRPIIATLDRTIATIVGALQWLALPLVLLLFLQWPLRDLIGCCSRPANDLGQIFFAVFVAASVTAATRAGTHLAADALAHRYSARARHRIRQAGALFGLMPWALFVLIASRTPVLGSFWQLEAFPDTANPGYYIIKLALWLMSLLVLAQAIVDLARPLQQDEP